MAPVQRPVVHRKAGILALLLLGAAGFVSPASAQLALLVEHEGKMLLVRRADGIQPYVEVNGRLVEATDRRFALKPVKDFLPFYVSVRDIEASSTYLDADGAAINNDFHFRATFESPYPLDHAFVVLDLNTERQGHVLFLQQIGPLQPGVPDRVALVVPMSSALGEGKYVYHVFVDGMEVLHSGIPLPLQEASLDRMVASRIAGEKEAPLKLFIGPNPEYPRALLKSRVKGEAAIALVVDPEGRVINPVVRSATKPAFGEAALAAVRFWRFLPRVHHGRPVATTVEVPFEFAPPK